MERDTLELQCVWRPERSGQWRRDGGCWQEAMTDGMSAWSGQRGRVPGHGSLRTKLAGLLKQSSSVNWNKSCLPLQTSMTKLFLRAAPFSLHLKVLRSAWGKTGKSVKTSLYSKPTSPLLSQTGQAIPPHVTGSDACPPAHAWHTSLQMQSILMEAGHVPGALMHVI